MVVLAPAEGCLFLFIFLLGPFEPFEFLETNVCDPRAPQGSRGTLGVRRNFANYPGVAQGPFGPFGIYTVHVFDPRGFPGIPRHSGSLGVIFRNAGSLSGFPRGSLGIPWASQGISQLANSMVGTQRGPFWECSWMFILSFGG